MEAYLQKTEQYLNDKLIPFWAERAVEPVYGGFQTNYERKTNGGKRKINACPLPEYFYYITCDAPWI